jgi:methylase of polypeptide subunit release factors
MNAAVLQARLQLRYRPELWRDLLNELFSDIELFSQRVERPLTTQSERDLATRLVQFGRVMLADGKFIGLFEVDVAPGVDLARNRAGLRRLIARCIDEVNAHAVLAFFVHPDAEQFRLSYAARETTLDTESLEIQTRETATRRYTYVLGPAEPVRTAAQRLAVLSEKRGTTELKDVTEAFSVERLNREFFATYKKHYQLFCDYLIRSEARETVFGISTHGLEEKARDRALKPIRDFVKKLLGRLIFLYFLQKKGWLGCPAERTDWENGDARFIRKLFDTCANKDKFHSERLVPLFFDTLNDRSRPNDVFAITGTRVPYLNGGLFERDFDQVAQIEFPGNLFADLLEFFGQYNFTIDENDPDDREIGIDPEMLGHIFENLLEENKDKGAYYTPKPVVQYMCQQSLIYYFQSNFPADDAEARAGIDRLIRYKDPIDPRDAHSWVARHAPRLDELLDCVSICDPAIGSGAFPMGLLQEIYWTKLTLHPGADRAATKRAIIQQSIYGVDIDPGAVEIARLRCWLALIVDEPTPLPLPNLDYQIMQGNSLLESFEGIDLSNLTEPIRYGIRVLGSEQHELDLPKTSTQLLETTTTARETLLDLEKRYFACHDPAEKEQLRSKIDAAVLAAIDDRLLHRRDEIEISIQQIKVFCRNRGFAAAEKDKLAAMHSEVRSLQEKQQRLHLLLANPRAERPFFLWHFWFRHVFAKGGFDLVIANPPYVSYYSRESASDAAAEELLKQLRPLFVFTKYATNKGRLNLWMFFAEKFVTLCRDKGITVFLADVNFTKDVAKNIRRFLVEHSIIRQFIHGLSEFEKVASGQVILMAERGVAPKTNTFLVKSSLQDPGVLQNQSEIVAPKYDFLAKSRDPVTVRLSHHKTIGQIDSIQVTTGVQVGGTELYKGKMVKDYFYRKHWDSKKVFPSVLVRSVSSYSTPTFHRGIVFDYDLATKITKATAKSAIVLHKYKKYLPKEKILIRQSAPHLIATIGSRGCCGEYSLFSLICKTRAFDLHFLLGLLNSKLFSHFAREARIIQCKKGTQPQIRKAGIESLPIPAIPLRSQLEVATLARQILAAKRSGDEATAKTLETKIDAIVYHLYGLTEDEITIVKNSTPRS